jgi:alkylhydroperoxidase/carboxymuconolactone decarboxylase family protein YurZ
MTGDAVWYEAAQVVGITNALNVAAETLDGLEGMDEVIGFAEVQALFAEIRDFYQCHDLPPGFRFIAQDPAYAAEVWATTRHAFADNQLARRLKEALAFAVSATSRSTSGAAFHLSQMRRLGVGARGIMEIVGVTQMFSSYTKIADTLQLEPDMGDIAPEDPSPAPGGRAR